MKLAIYAICKNESKHVEWWLEGIKGADGIYVLDTGSDDNTQELLLKHGVHVDREIFNPWRFDYARNAALARVPLYYDWVFSIDLDEVPTPGWYEAIEAAIREKPGCNRLWYEYVWNHNADGTPATTMWKEKCHTRTGFKWKHAVHEILVPIGVDERYATCHGFTLHHWADDNKPRSQYLPLLELSVQEEPDDDRQAHYYGRELFFYQRYTEAIVELQRHLSLPRAQWLPERANSMRLISRSYAAMGQSLEAITWALRACAEAPGEREPWLQLALCYNAVDNHEGTLFAATQALKITERPRTYISEPESWGALPYDLLSVSLFYLGAKEDALHAVQKALEYESDNPRFIENLRHITSS